MKVYVLVICAWLLAACHPAANTTVSETKTATIAHDTVKTVINPVIPAVKQEAATEIKNADDAYSDYSTYYVVVADTGLNYHTLYQKLAKIKQQLNMPVDLMGRSFDQNKDLIALPEDDEDTMYAGEYYPRRSPSENLSLEYMTVYHPASNPKTIALVSGIYEHEKSADSALYILKQAEKRSFKLRSDVYVGCMH